MRSEAVRLCKLHTPMCLNLRPFLAFLTAQKCTLCAVWIRANTELSRCEFRQYPIVGILWISRSPRWCKSVSLFLPVMTLRGRHG